MEGPHPWGGELATARHPETGDVIGTMRFDRSQRFMTPEQKGHVGVEYVAVDPEHRRQGVAAALYEGVHKETGMPFLHHRDDMSPDARAAVGKLASQQPGLHKEAAWRKGEPVVRAYPRKRA
jgi:GNAT superfamily N-acetyltransferase